MDHLKPTIVCNGLTSAVVEPCLLFFPPPEEGPEIILTSSCAYKHNSHII